MTDAALLDHIASLPHAKANFKQLVREMGAKGPDRGDEHGHRWHFVRVYKRDRYGRLLDGNDQVVPDSDPERFRRAVHLKDIHLEKGMQCIDCHGAGDSHGDGKLYSQMRETIEIRCWDCHGTATTRPTLKTSGPTGGRDLTKEQTPFGKPWMERRGGKVVQNSKMTEGLVWEVKQVLDSIDPASDRGLSDANLEPFLGVKNLGCSARSRGREKILQLLYALPLVQFMLVVVLNFLARQIISE